MASTTSLGLHQPTALSYLIQEGLLPPEPTSDLYTWQNTINNDDGIIGDDELVTTQTCVVWSRGGLVRKTFRFEAENEPVTQAILTNFYPENRKIVRSHHTGNQQESPETSNAAPSASFTTGTKVKNDRKTRALVVFLRTQAHIYFLSGTNYVVHLPFEVDYALAAPNGLIVQRKVRAERFGGGSLQFPRVPPSSFVSSKPQAWSGTDSRHSNFSAESLGSPKQLPLPPTILVGEAWQTTPLKDDSTWPRLFSLTDPLSEMGLVVTSKSGGRGSVKAFPVDQAEEVVHITDVNEFASIASDGDKPLVLAVTLNRETAMYTVWRVTYTEHENFLFYRSKIDGSARRRRSSFAPGAATGATTPNVNGSLAFRESLGGIGINRNKHLNPSENGEADEKLDFATSLEMDFEAPGVPRRKSRRVSSMLARADLSASHERSVFSELANGPQASRRGESLGSQHTRNSMGYHSNHRTTAPQSHFNNSINSFFDAPVDDLLEELRVGGDLEGFHHMGLDDNDFDALKKEINFSKVGSIPAEHSNVRFSSQNKPANTQCQIFTLAAPLNAAEDLTKNQIVVCILDTEEKKLMVVNVNIKKTQGPPNHHDSSHDAAPQTKDTLSITFGELMRAKGVLDACKLEDGAIKRLLILTETSSGYGELTLQAPWGLLMKVNLPAQLVLNNVRNLGQHPAPQNKRESGIRRVFSRKSGALRRLRNSLPSGIVDVEDDEGRAHQVRIRMEPRNPLVQQVIDICRYILPGNQNGEAILHAWWNAHQWYSSQFSTSLEAEWSAIIIVLFSLAISFQETASLSSTPSRHSRSRSRLLRSSSGAQSDTGDLQDMFSQEAGLGAPQPSWMFNKGWGWLSETMPIGMQYADQDSEGSFLNSTEHSGFMKKHIDLSRQFLGSNLGQAATGASGYLPTAGDKSHEVRSKALVDIVLGLQLLHEDRKLDITFTDSLDANGGSLTPILAQLCQWLGWKSWVAFYEVEEASMCGLNLDTSLSLSVPTLSTPPSIHGWIEACLTDKTYHPFISLDDIVDGRLDANVAEEVRASTLLCRTQLLRQFFRNIKPNFSSVELVEALYGSGITTQVIETLPESILVPVRECLVDCQPQPPVAWSQELLGLVDRDDMKRLLAPKRRRLAHSAILAPTHEAVGDIRGICNSNFENETLGSFDGSAEVDRQAITRLIFKDDRRFNEAARILNTSKPTIARCDPEPDWSESDLLEAQKDHVQMLAIRTLAIPTGRGLLYFSARIPLLTEKFPIGGFNLHCIMKPTNNTVGVDKNAFTEEKVCWAFFHAGVSAGLSISRDAKGIDTSWILYNKPQELSNRHAGFLLALGLNGHLKSVAKWVAFKYLTPKHTMTSIGLLLGLAASYLGTMDSLITRLLSVHVTRMLPVGAAELNLSPLTQTTGIMGIGLLYCNTQHRRMSEIMVSEIENTDPEIDEEPLRNEGYRLAAGFALGLINLGKGSDLKGLHDMRLTERLLRLAVGTKKVSLVHILDKATAAAVVALALIYMKSEDQALARKIDVPSSLLQYDYVRSDMFLLRTLAKHMIMWNKIEASIPWIEKNLPPAYRDRSRLSQRLFPSSEDLPFYNIITGLCFSIALRHAGTGSVHVRDLLVYYIDQMTAICSIPAHTYDEKLARNTIRNCLDLVALGAATVMAGTGDLIVFRRLRAMHGRDDIDTPYGSHLVAHLAIGALFLGGGTHTFGTSNLAIASLIIAFYPIFPTSILDNKSHLQAFRHFWVLAAEPRCLVARDVDTNRPVSVPLSITLKSGRQSSGHAPCLLPELQNIASVHTNSREYWNIVLDFEKNPTHLESFKLTQSIFVRRRPAYDASTAVFHGTLQALDDTDSASKHPLEWLFNLPAFSMLTTAERALVLPPENSAAANHTSTEGTLVDIRMVLEKATLSSGKRDRLLGLKLLFAWADKLQSEGKELRYVRKEVLDRLKAEVWLLRQEDEDEG